MRKMICLLFLSLFVFLQVCITGVQGRPLPDEAPYPELHIHILSGLEEYAAVKTLRDPETRRLLEEKLGRRIVLFSHADTFQNAESFSIDFDDILLVDNPLYLIPMRAQGKLKRISSFLEMAEKPYGILSGTQYGYVFNDPAFPCRIHPRLLILPEYFEAMGIRDVPFTPEGFLSILEKLTASVTIQYARSADSRTEARMVSMPLAVYGSPLSEGFSMLLALFDLSPQGGREFLVTDDGHTAYDKLTPAGTDYLTYIRELYGEQFIPEDCLSLSEYSLIGMLDNDQCAMFVVLDDAVQNALVKKAEEQGRRIAFADIPVPAERMEGNIYRRLIGVVGTGIDQVSAAEEFFTELQKLSEERKTEADDSGPELEHYPLFLQEDDQSAVVDPVETRFRSVNRLYEKYVWDMEKLNPGYHRMAVGEMEIRESDWFFEEWTSEISEDDERVTNGLALLDLFDRWYRNDAENQ